LKKKQSFSCVKELQINLEIGIKNKIKAALLQGEGGEKINVFSSPEVIVNARLPEVEVRATPDVYNGLVNLA
jgi:hypothetical protein